MAKGITASGKMSVGRFEKEFEQEFGVRIEVKVGKRLADNSATLASLRPKDFKGAKSADFKVAGNMLVGNVKKNIHNTFGVTVDLYYGRRIASDEITLSALRDGNVKKDKPGEKPKTQGKIEMKKLNKDSVKLCIEVEGDLEPDGRFISVGYNLSVATSGGEALFIPLYDAQCDSNYFFDLLIFCGISFLKTISIMEYEDEKQMESYMELNNNILIDSPNPITPIVIEDEESLLLYSEIMEDDKNEMKPGFYINTEGFEETNSEIIQNLNEILSGAGAEILLK